MKSKKEDKNRDGRERKGKEGRLGKKCIEKGRDGKRKFGEK